ncbi:MAG: xanthine dehydrogenase molybdopterin binding subunit [Verrucomicrobiota bacterium]|jgi:xanthine dehydrogenase molybdopterin binding subunit/xanthine dehydrogenase small subunit
MAAALEFILNGRPIRAERCSPNTTLLEFLRAAGLTGSKEGCAEGDCGACSVLLLDKDARGKTTYRAINSCLAPVCLLAGREILTVEGVAGPRGLHPVQREMVERHGSQCGYCTPGFICSLLEGYYRDDLKTAGDLDDQLAGNLCRCTGYRPIRAAAAAAFAQRHAANAEDPLAGRLAAPCPPLAALEYECDGEQFFRPASLADLLALLRRVPGARLIAGATELGLDMAKFYKKFPALVSVEAVPELREIKATAAEWHLGAAATVTQIEEALAGEFPAVGDMLRVFGSRQIRNRATLGGNLATASPIGDSAPLLLACDARVVLASLAGERVLPLHQFFASYRKTALQPGEVLKSIVLPRGPSEAGLIRHSRWLKVSRRREVDISIVAGCFVVDVDRRNIIRHARLAYGGVAAMPARALRAEAALPGQPWSAQTVAGVLPILRAEFTPISDVRGSAEYRRALITSLFEKFFHEDGFEEPSTAPALTAGGASRAPAHESAHLHVTGQAIYTDDQAAGKDVLETWPVCAPHARARILRRDASAARLLPGIRAVLLAEDVPGANNVGGVKKDEILLADKEVFFHGQIVALVVGQSQAACRAAAEKVVVEYQPLPPVLTIAQALAENSFHNEPNFIRRADVAAALEQSPFCLEGEFELAGQEHFYLETHAACAEPGEDGAMLVTSSTQHPSEVQQVVARVLNLPANKVVVQCPRMGGGFGGKETQAATPAALAALAARQTGRPARVRLNRDQDMALLGHRHPFLARFRVGFDAGGVLRAARIHLWSNGGWAMDLSQAITDRALFHLDNSCFIPAAEFRGQVARTNLSSNTAFRGFGGPQGMLIIEEILDRVARRLGLPPETVRERNLYRGRGETNTTPYGQELEDNRLQTIWHDLKESSAFQARRQEVARWNAAHPHRKRGLAMTPVKFGISFTVSHLNQAGALVLIYQDGSVQVNHGGTEMGQGIHTNIRAIAAAELGLPPERIRVMPTSTEKIPNTSATAASAGTDLNGAAVKNACEILRERLAAAAAARLSSGAEKLVFADGAISVAGAPGRRVAFADVVKQAYLDRVSLSAAGYYATPGIHWDRAAGRGRPFHYFAYGAAAAEVEVDAFTGMHRVLRVDLLEDAGDSINEGVNRGQIEGGFIQGMGWLTTEELKWDDQGRLLTHSPDTYKIPSIGDTPLVFNVTLLQNAAQKNVIYGSKAVGEPPLMLALSVREALRDAIAAFGPPGGQAPLPAPATCEAIFLAIRRRLDAPQPAIQPQSTTPIDSR